MPRGISMKVIWVILQSSSQFDNIKSSFTAACRRGSAPLWRGNAPFAVILGHTCRHLPGTFQGPRAVSILTPLTPPRLFLDSCSQVGTKIRAEQFGNALRSEPRGPSSPRPREDADQHRDSSDTSERAVLIIESLFYLQRGLGVTLALSLDLHCRSREPQRGGGVNRAMRNALMKHAFHVDRRPKAGDRKQVTAQGACMVQLACVHMHGTAGMRLALFGSSSNSSGMYLPPPPLVTGPDPPPGVIFFVRRQCVSGTRLLIAGSTFHSMGG